MKKSLSHLPPHKRAALKRIVGYIREEVDPAMIILFELLKKAYVDARYKKSYKITKRELEYLAGRVRKLRTLTRKICREKIASFTGNA